MIKKSSLATFTLFLSLFTNSSLFAEDAGTCYSVQLASVYNKNSIYFNQDSYPSSCKIISLTNLKAVRCGCYEDKDEAKQSLKKLRHDYRGAILVRTYKSRFINKPTIAAQDKAILIKSSDAISKKKPKSVQKESSDKKVPAKEKRALPAVDKWLKSFVDEGELSLQGDVELSLQNYMLRPDNKNKTNLTASSQLELEYIHDDMSVIAKLYAQADLHDIKGSSQKNNRSFLRIDELYIKQDFEDDMVQVGKSINFWGALEARNITDTFNPDDPRSDIFNSDKLGVWNAAYTHYTETGELSLIGTLYEQGRRMAAVPYVYYFFPQTVPTAVGNLPLNYDSTLTAEYAQRPSFFIKYAGSTDSEYALDYALIYENGYDSQRYYTYELLNNNTSVSTNENAYLVNKIMTYDTLVIDSTLVKFEGVYTDVISSDDIIDANGSIRNISDYYHFGIGTEHTLTQFYNDADLGLIAEYYRYGIVGKGNSFTDIELFEINQNDLFLGARYSFNEGNDASLIGGGIFDLDYDEQVFYVEYDGRIADTFKLNIDFRHIEPSKETNTAFKLMGRHQRIGARLGYYF